MKGYIHSIETFGTVDGPGTRFVVFFQGCNLRCKYCHNPDTWKLRCSEEMTVEEILSQYEQVSEFITGGITVTGGDPLMQLDFLISLLKACKEKGIHTCVDTAGGMFSRKNASKMKKLERLTKYTDLFLLDIKHIDSEKHLDLVGIGNENILDFAKFLDDLGAEMWIRHVLIPTITDDDGDLYKLGEFIATLKNVKGVEVLPYHMMALAKYESMGLDYPLKDISPATDEMADRARKLILLARRNKLEELSN